MHSWLEDDVRSRSVRFQKSLIVFEMILNLIGQYKSRVVRKRVVPHILEYAGTVGVPIHFGVRWNNAPLKLRMTGYWKEVFVIHVQRIDRPRDEKAYQKLNNENR